MSGRQRSTTILLRSSDAEVLDSTTYVFKLVTPLVARPDEILSVSVEQANIPNTFYNITSRNNAIEITETVSGTQTARVVSIDPGNYDALTLKTAFLEAINTPGNVQYTMSFSRINGKFTLSTTHAGVTAVSVQATVASLRRALGFSLGTHAFSTVAGVLTLVSDQCVDLSSNNHSILIKSSFSSASFISSKSMRPEGIIAAIPINAGSFDMITYVNELQKTVLLSDQQVDVFSLTILNQDDISLDFNGVPFEITLKLAFQRVPEYEDKALDLQRRLLSVNNKVLARQIERAKKEEQAMSREISGKRKSVLKRAKAIAESEKANNKG